MDQDVYIVSKYLPTKHILVSKEKAVIYSNKPGRPYLK